jgi:predicted extracellular nuclease
MEAPVIIIATRTARSMWCACLLWALLFATSPASGQTVGSHPPVITRIFEIQGAAHVSPFVGKSVTTEGIVTAVAFDGYYVQDPMGDGDDATSDGIFVFIGSSGAKPAIGDGVRLTDSVVEFVPGGAATANLSVTELTSPVTTVLSNGNTLPPPVVIGRGGRIPPNVHVITPSETPINLQTSAGVFNPAIDGIDFYESLEGMRVLVRDAVAVSPLRRFGTFSSEAFTLPDNGAHIAPRGARTARGGLSVQPDPDNRGDQNPERVQIQFDASADAIGAPGSPGTLYPGKPPIFKVGDRLGNLTGVMSYDFGNFEVRLTEAVPIVRPSAIGPQVTALKGESRKVTIATYNVLNLGPDATDDPQRATLAAQIVHNLQSPDILALQEIQDNSGELDNGVTDASLTLAALVGAITAAGGPRYRFVDVAPANNSSGGVPGGNIRNAYLYNDARVELSEVTSLTPAALSALGVANPNAFAAARAPLLAEFDFQGQKITIINNHLSSRSGSTPLFGGPQPFLQAAESAREAQARTLNEVVNHLVSRNAATHVIVLGDFNTFEFTNDLTDLLPGTGPNRVLVNLVTTLTDDNVYSYNFEGNAQLLDHVFVTRALVRRSELDIVHVNSDFPFIDPVAGNSDHEPLLLRLEVAADNQER